VKKLNASNLLKKKSASKASAPLNPKKANIQRKGKKMLETKNNSALKLLPSSSSKSVTPPLPVFSCGVSIVPAELKDARTDVDLKDYQFGTPSASSGGHLDLVFCLDCTGSMGSTITSCKNSIESLVKTLTQIDGLDVRFSLIPYRDHGASEQFCTKVYPFTWDTQQMKRNVDSQSASGGGDTPEAVTAAMYEALCLDWRDDAAKVVVFMADAGPHGLGEGHSFPDGDPDGKDPLCIVREMESLGITVYSVVTGGSENTKHFFAAISAISGGQCFLLANSNLLEETILQGARDSIDIEKRILLVRPKLLEATSAKGGALTTEEAAKITKKIFAESSVKCGSIPEDKLVTLSDVKLQQAREATTITELRTLWSGFGSASSIIPKTSAPLSKKDSFNLRVSKLAIARDSRSKDPVLVECVKEGGKVRVRVISPGYDPNKNCQFPRSIRETGKRFLVDTVVDVGSFYQTKGNIVPA